MALIKWRDSYSVGVGEFDEEHKLIVTMVNEMYEVVKDKNSNTSVSHEVDRLIKYTKDHFTNEEKAMEKAGYNFLENHRDIHKGLIEEVVDFKEKIESNKDGIHSDFYLFLRDWLLKHILEEDMKYSDCLSNISEKTPEVA
jgi:hemerythrin